MFFATNNFLAGNMYSMSFTPTNVNECNNIKLMNSVFDYLYVSEGNVYEPIPEGQQEWDIYTIFLADFNGTTTAKNVDFRFQDITHILVERRNLDEENPQWTIVQAKEINNADDMIITGVDITPNPGTYEYAAVPVANGIWGNIYKNEIEVETTELVIADDTGVWWTAMTDGFCNTTYVLPNQIIETIYNKYPTVYSFGKANYQQINVGGRWIPLDCSNVDNYFEYKNYAKEIEAFCAFLTNRRPKILKAPDGRRWLVSVTTPPTNNAEDHYLKRVVTFDCTEIGNANNEEDLYNANIINVGEEWW